MEYHTHAPYFKKKKSHFGANNDIKILGIMKQKIEWTNPRKRQNNWPSKQKQDSRKKKHKSHKDSIQIQTLQKVGSFTKTLWNCFCSGFGVVVFVDVGGCFVPFSCGALTTKGPTVLGGGEANDNN